MADVQEKMWMALDDDKTAAALYELNKVNCRANTLYNARVDIGGTMLFNLKVLETRREELLRNITLYYADVERGE
eukprot:7966858-Pyramimonas_sp.AAC.2